MAAHTRRSLLKNLFGIRKSARAEIPDTERSLVLLRDKGFNPKTIIDCGAYVGRWTQMARRIFPDAVFLMLEANPAKERRLKEVQEAAPATTRYAIAVIGAESRPSVRFYQMESGSSVFEEQSGVPRNIMESPMRTLDEIVLEKNLTDVHFIKLDVQGYELEILKGAPEALRTVLAVLMEVSFLQYNAGAPLFAEVIRFMDERGFVVYDIGSLVRWQGDNSLLQADLLFVRKDSPFRPAKF
jgi:FkbM family methyltransferase